MSRKSQAAAVVEEQEQHEAAQMTAEPDDAAETPEGTTHTDVLHIEEAHRWVKCPLSDEDHEVYEKQLVRATLAAKRIRLESQASNRGFNERIRKQQDEAMIAAEQLQSGGSPQHLPCLCVWDLKAGVYREIVKTTDEVVRERTLTVQEIQRFSQATLPGMRAESWLSGDEAVAAARDDETPDDDRDDDDEGTDGEDEDYGDQDDEDEGDA